MAVYWVTFRIADQGNSAARYELIRAALGDLAGGKWWVEPTSFVMFECEQPINTVAGHISAAINNETDVALVSTLNGSSARLIGASEDPDIFKFMPQAKEFK
jgi:hypothetical protein